jgi:glycine dehydrogenase subunit 1
LAALGKKGFRELGELCVQKAHYAFRQITAIPGFKAAFSAPFFDEFVIQSPIPLYALQQHFDQANIIGGYPLNECYPDMEHAMLFCVTETRTKEDIDLLVNILKEVQV